MRPAAAFMIAAALSAAMALPARAPAHATLLGAQPSHGQTLDRAPARMVLRFDEAIDTAFVALRVEDDDGRSVDRGEPFHPDGREELVAVRLEPDIAGTFTARYRVISEDGHPVRKRTRFVVRPPVRAEAEREADAEAMPPPPPGTDPVAPSMDGMPAGVDEEERSGVTGVAFAAARGLGYLALALTIGGLVFLVAVWMPALRGRGGAEPGWRTVSEGFARTLERFLLAAVVLGVVATAATIALEAATVAGVSFWVALDPARVEPLADTRMVQAWTARVVLFLALGLLLRSALRPRRTPVLRRAALGADGLVLGSFPGRRHGLLLLGTVVALALTAPLAGHSASHSPSGLLICADLVHVLCMSAWLGGLVLLLVAVAVCGRGLAPGERTPLLAAVVGRFSRVATVAVAVLIATGITQSVVLVGSVEALFDTAYGRFVVVKVGVLVLLLALGGYNQRRSLPRLRRLAAGAEEPGRAAVLLSRAVAVEVALVLVVIGVTSVLVAAEPPAS